MLEGLWTWLKKGRGLEQTKETYCIRTKLPLFLGEVGSQLDELLLLEMIVLALCELVSGDRNSKGVTGDPEGLYKILKFPIKYLCIEKSDNLRIRV